MFSFTFNCYGEKLSDNWITRIAVRMCHFFSSVDCMTNQRDTLIQFKLWLYHNYTHCQPMPFNANQCKVIHQKKCNQRRKYFWQPQNESKANCNQLNVVAPLTVQIIFAELIRSIQLTSGWFSVEQLKRKKPTHSITR